MLRGGRNLFSAWHNGIENFVSSEDFLLVLLLSFTDSRSALQLGFAVKGDRTVGAVAILGGGKPASVETIGKK